MAFVLASDIATFSQTIYEDAMHVARDNNIMAALVTNFMDRSGTANRSSSEYGTATVNSIGEADDLTSQAFTPTVDQTLTPGEFGMQFFITDTRIETDPFGAQADAALELGMAMAEKIETDLVGNFQSLTGGTVGAAGTTITWGHFMAMIGRLRNQKAPKPWNFVCHPYHWHNLGKTAGTGATVTNVAEKLEDELFRDFYVGTAFGVDIYTTSNISVDASDDAYCAMFSPIAIALDMRRGVRLEPERDASRRGLELNLTALYAEGVWRPKYGIQGIFDAAAPSS